MHIIARVVSNLLCYFFGLFVKLITNVWNFLMTIFTPAILVRLFETLILI